MTCCKKVLVTGATGLIGKELIVPLKEAGFEIYALTIDAENPNNGVNWTKGNLFDEIFIKETFEKVKPEYLLNMAWTTTGDYLTSDANYDFLKAGINLLKYFKANGGRRAVFAGTCFEYKFKSGPLKETDELDSDKTAYTFCKNKLREIAEYYCKENGISFGWGRIFYVFGRNENKTRLTGMIANSIKNNEKFTINCSNLLKDYMYSKDIAGAFVKFLDSDVNGTVNICTGKSISLKDFALEFVKCAGKDDLAVLKEDTTNQPPVILGDNTRLLKEVRYECKYDIRKAAEEILNER